MFAEPFGLSHHQNRLKDSNEYKLGVFASFIIKSVHLFYYVAISNQANWIVMLVGQMVFFSFFLL